MGRFPRRHAADADTADVERLRSIDDPIALDEVRRIYLSMSRLLSAHVEASQVLFRQRSQFLNASDRAKTPFIIGIAGSVAVGKSTTARILKELLKRWPSSPKVDLVTTDGFLLPNETLRERNLMDRKGFPESYDVGALLRFLSAIKAGERDVKAPLYSHLTYDVLPGEFTSIDRPDILIFEGINVLQSRELPKDGKVVPFVSDFFDFSIYIDADEKLIDNWYVARFMRLRETAFSDPHSFFHRYSSLSEERGAGHRREPVGQHQPGQSARKHPADAAARRPHPAQGRGSPGRAGSAAAALAAESVTRRGLGGWPSGGSVPWRRAMLRFAGAGRLVGLDGRELFHGKASTHDGRACCMAMAFWWRPQPVFVTRRKVRLMRPPFFSKVEVSG